MGLLRRLRLLAMTGFVAAAAVAEPVWIVGDSYVARVEGKMALHTGVSPGSYGFDAGGCGVWVADAETGKLWAFTSKGPAEKGRAAAVLSDVVDGRFLTRAADGKLEVRDAEGAVESSLPADWAARSLQVALGGKAAWSLQYAKDQNRPSVLVLDEAFSAVKEIPFHAGGVIWPNHRLARNAATGDLWIGFTTAAPGLSSGARVERRGSDGALLAEYQVKERGQFFDVCADRDGSALAARDIPSDSGFTVPFHAYLDRVAADGKAERAYTSDTNVFIDAVDCGGDDVWMAQRSIFGSDGSDLVKWNRKPGELGERVLRLPGRGQKVFACRPAPSR